MRAPAYRDPSLSPEERTKDLLGRMTPDEKIAQLSMYANDFREVLRALERGDLPPEGISSAYIADAVSPEDVNRVQRYQLEHTRLGIPVLIAGEAIHGLMYTGATVFPQAIGLGATFDPELMAEIAEVIGREADAAGVRQVYAPDIDLSRDPRWGRTEENYGEDPYLTARLAVAYIHAVQAHHVAATAKHYLAHGSPEGGINTSPTHMGEREIRETALEPFAAAVREGGCLSVMPAYSEIDGIPMHASGYWLRRVLKGELGFSGFVSADCDGVRLLMEEHHVADTPREAGLRALAAGVDHEMTVFGFGKGLKEAVAEGKVPIAHVDEAVTRILRVKFRLGLFEHPFADPRVFTILRQRDAVALAYRAAVESAVLLKNDGILPLATDGKKIAVIGPGADYPRLGGYTPPGPEAYSVTLRSALTAALGEEQVLYARGCHIAAADDLEAAVATAKQADVCILVLGDNSAAWGGKTWGDEEGGNCVTCGENYDSPTLTLPGAQRDLLRAIHGTEKPVILVLETGRPYCIGEECAMADAVVEAWYPGEQGGNALCALLLGQENFSGKLPVTFPKSPGHLPCSYHYKPTARRISPIPNDGRSENPAALFPFGYGLSYTRFTYSGLAVQDRTVSIRVKNTGAFSGKETVLLFLTQHCCPVTPFVRRLRGIRKVFLRPGEEKTVHFTLTNEDLSYIGEAMTPERGKGTFTVAVGGLFAEFEGRED